MKNPIRAWLRSRRLKRLRVEREQRHHERLYDELMAAYIGAEDYTEVRLLMQLVMQTRR